ncbi:hypothetical protein DBR32_01480 [Taibaiella sp. KBW10]|uniref:energy transducer TonB n=1 Tax=Taibaiella sp. KBW10 TaxID=2153357 RepID=UPI000F5924EB|nr:energy transducer TonB [Taibaiella sp. KBW10]RQO32309.1 hypothetical protein DBR32_01480 [Taibaiella sp. KBW10]
MKKLIPALYLLFTGSIVASSQETSVVFFDQHNERTVSKNTANSYKVFVEDATDPNLVSVKEINLYTKEYNTGMVTKKDSLNQGVFKYYNSEKQLVKEITFVNGIREGMASEYTNDHKTATYPFSEQFIKGTVEEFYVSGKLKAKKNYLSNTDQIIRVINQDTAAVNYLLQNGRSDTLSLKEKMYKIEGIYDGACTYYYESGTVASEETFQQGKLIKALFYDTLGSLVKTEKNPWNLDKMPSYKGNYINYLSNNIRYPNKALEERITGTVVIGFNIAQDGKMTDVWILKSVHPLLDNEALRVIKSTYKKWSPGKYHNIPMTKPFIAPIIFNLQ